MFKHVYYKFMYIYILLIKDIRQEDCAQVGIERLCWSFYLVWRPSSEEIPGRSHVPSCPSPNSRLLLAIMMIEPVAIGSYSYQTSLLFLSPYCSARGKTQINLTVVIHILLHSLLLKCLWLLMWSSSPNNPAIDVNKYFTTEHPSAIQT